MGSMTHRQVPVFSSSWRLFSPVLVAQFSGFTQASVTSVAARVPEVELLQSPSRRGAKISKSPPFRPKGVARTAIGTLGMSGITFCAPEVPSGPAIVEFQEVRKSTNES